MKEKLLLLMTDLDHTLTPISADGLLELAVVIKQIEAKNGVKVKLVPISGRPASYTHAMMQIMHATFARCGLGHVVELGVGEQGAVAVWTEDNVTEKYIGKNPFAAIQKEALRRFYESSPFEKLFSQQPSNRYNSSFVIKKRELERLKESVINELKINDGEGLGIFSKNPATVFSTQRLFLNLRLNQKITEYQTAFMKAIHERFGEAFVMSCSGVLEVTPKGMDKANAIQWVITEMEKQHDIRGMIYCGDSENDRAAVRLLSNWADLTDKACHVFLPSNAIPALESHQMEAWKDRMQSLQLKKIIQKAGMPKGEDASILTSQEQKKREHKSYQGIIYLLKQNLAQDTLVSTNPRSRKSLKIKDDFEIRYPSMG